jgi:aryl sulfotransferase
MLPQLIHTYQNHHMDSMRWSHFTPREDDIIISTPYKSGTTWMQEIALQLAFLGQEAPYRAEISPWLDSRSRPLEDVLRKLEAQRHRRCIKTHLALDGLPFYPSVKYIVVGRDPRDVFMSLWNHYTSHTPDYYRSLNQLPGRVGDPFPPPPADIHEFWREWISRSWFEWEHEGYPYWGSMHHLQTWWDYRHLSNILLVHFADLLAGAFQEIRRVADFLDIPASDEQIAATVQQTSLTAMRVRAEQSDSRMREVWVDGARTFFYKGTNGRWKEVLSGEELAMYERTAAKVLTQDCRTWLEQGRSAMRMGGMV